MKICVITFHNAKNYGAVLQAYATQRVFEKLGFDVEILDYQRKYDRDDKILKYRLAESEKWNLNFLTRLIYIIIKKPSIRKNCKIFGRFLKRRIRLSEQTYYSEEQLLLNAPDADVFCTGSDQTWNSVINRGILEPYFLSFVPDGKKKISFSASFGKPELEDWEKEKTGQLLKKYDFISVRESSGLVILRELGINNAAHLLDPTLVLREKDWEQITPSPIFNNKYILIFQNMADRTADVYAKQLAKKKNLRLIRLGDTYDKIAKTGKLIFCPEVEQFLSLIKHAEYILTDSFHGAAFSINFNKQFIAFKPRRFSGRVNSLLELAGLQDRLLIDYNDFGIAEKQIDYKPVNKILELERKKTEDFLVNALKG